MLVAPAERLARRQRVAAACRRLSLSQQAVTLCEQARPSQEAFLMTVLEAELAHREAQRRTRLLNRAGFPTLKTLDGYDRTHVQLPSTVTWADLETGAYLTAARNLVLFGPVGTGKSHLATALGVRACEQGYTVRFFTVTDLVLRLSEARRAGTLERLQQDLQRADLLILDEWGYVPVDREGAQLLFRVIADSYETRSLILTTNLEFSKWGSLFTDDQMAAAMIDRLAHHGHLLLFDGESYRMTHALMKER
jgi:DNA replication protein DnaC